jgi:hypothetical protein
MALVRFVPLYLVAMPLSIITIIETPFVSTPFTIVGSIKSKPHTPRGTKIVNLHEDFRRKVNNFFTSQPSNQGGGSSDPPIPSRYFGLPMVHPSRPPLPPSKPYHRPFNYLEYVKDFDPNAQVKVFKVAIRTNNEIDDAKIVNLLSFTLRDTMSNWCNNYLGDYRDCTFAEL